MVDDMVDDKHHHEQQQHDGDAQDATEEEEEDGLIDSDSPGKEQWQQQHEPGYPQGLHSGSCGGVKRQRLGFDSPAEPNSQPHALADILNQQHQQLGGSAGPGKAASAAAGGGSFGIGSFVFEHNVAGSDRDDSAFD
jgi:hypothetical protein